MSFSDHTRGSFNVWRLAFAWFVSGMVLLSTSGKAIGQETLVFKGHMDPEIRPNGGRPKLEGVAFSPDGRLIASGGGIAHCVIVWNASTGEKVWSFENLSLGAFAFSPDGRSLALSFPDDHSWLVVLFEVATWKERHRFKKTGRGDDLFFSPDGQMLAWSTDDDDTYLVRLGPTEEQQPAPTALHVAPKRNDRGWRRIFSPDSKHLIVGYRNGEVRYWDCSSGKEVLNLSAGKPVYGLAVSADGNTLFVLADPRPNKHNGVLQVRELSTGQSRLAGIMPPLNYDSYYLECAAREDVLVVGSHRCLSIFKGPDPKIWATRSIHEGALMKAVSVSPDGKRIATANSDGTVSIIDVPKEKEEILRWPAD